MMKRRRQGKTCVVGGCANSTKQGWSVFKWPSSEETGRKWSSFIASTRKWSRDDYKLPHVCSGHFTAQQFANLNDWRNGFASRLRLTALGFPSVRVANSTLFVRKAASNVRIYTLVQVFIFKSTNLLLLINAYINIYACFLDISNLVEYTMKNAAILNNFTLKMYFYVITAL